VGLSVEVVAALAALVVLILVTRSISNRNKKRVSLGQANERVDLLPLPHVRGTAVDRMSMSQILPLEESYAKFGVIRVRALDRPLRNVRAELRVKRIADPRSGGDNASAYTSEGYANWFSAGIRGAFLGDKPAIARVKLNSAVLAQCLKNPVQDAILRSEPEDILLFYVVENDPRVLLCTGSGQVAGVLEDETPVQFLVDITIMAEGYRWDNWRFAVTVSRDDFKLVRL
jgi:hypothetical protein